VEELKPFIDKTFPSLPDRSNTFVAGSSMGGLISLYAICEYPKVFGGAACLSAHWVGTFSFGKPKLVSPLLPFFNSRKIQKEQNLGKVLPYTKQIPSKGGCDKSHLTFNKDCKMNYRQID